MNLAPLVWSVLLGLQWDSALRATLPACPDVPEVGNATYEDLERHDTSPYMRVRYTCNGGYYLEGSHEIGCVDAEQGREWHPEPPACHAFKDCEDILDIPNGYVSGHECCKPGDKLSFDCDDEVTHQLIGESELTCLSNGSWDHSAPQCLSRNCRPIEKPPRGDVDYYKDGDLYYGDCCEHGVEADFICDDEHDLVGQERLTCWNRQWSAPRPRCKPKEVEVCEDLVVPNSVVTGNKSGGDYFVPNDAVKVDCNHGYRTDGTVYLECKEDGTWSDPVPSCVEYNCTRMDFGAHIIVEEFVNSNVTEFPVDSRIYLKCEEGYMLEGASSLVCAGGGWSSAPKCHRIHCGRPSVPEFGWMKINTSFIDDVASFGCLPGYKLIGDQNRFCLANGAWSGSVTRCVSEVGLAAQRGCESPGIPDNGLKMGSSYGPGAKVYFSCNPGYRLRGNDTILCDHRGFWSHPRPTCIGKFYYDTPLQVKEKLMKPLTDIGNVSDTPDENYRTRALSLNVSGVRHVVYFVIDASSSIGERDFLKGVALARAIIMKINVTQRGNRVGVITFGNSAALIVKPLSHTSMDLVLEQLRSVNYTGGATAIEAALEAVKRDYNTIWARFRADPKKLKLSIFLISDGTANLGGSPKQVMTILGKGTYNATVYGICVTSSPNREALTELVSRPIEDHLFILRDYDSILWLAETLTNGVVRATLPACPDVPEVGNATYEDLERHDTSPYMRVRYTCNEGYYLEGSHEIGCVDAEQGREWHPEPPACHAFKDCEEILDIPNRYVTGDECCKPGDKLSFDCDDEVTHQLVGESELTCLNNGSWDHSAPQCLSRNCRPIEKPPRGDVDYYKDGALYYDDCCEHGVEAHFICDDEHDLVGQERLTCWNRQWSAPRPRCKPKEVEVCEDLVVPNSVVTGNKSGGDYFVPNDAVKVDCNHGYRTDGTVYLECKEDGTWSDPVPSCVEYNCTRMDFGAHIIVEEFVNSNVTEFPVDSRIYLKCEEGYMLEGASSLVCAGGGWSSAPKCHRIHCGRPSVPEFGWMKINTSFIDDVASFGCLPGYKLIGDENRFCLANGAWTGSVTRCVSEVGLGAERGCESPGIPDNGLKMGSSYGPGAEVYFSCNPGYRLRGNDTILCDHRGFWSHPRPTCIGKFYYDTPLEVKEKLMKPLTDIGNVSDTPDENYRTRALSLNVSGVRHVVYFVIDASSSIGERDFLKGVTLARAIIMKINVTERGNRVGVITFSNNAALIVKPLSHTSMDLVLEQLRSINYTGGATALEEALETVERDYFTIWARLRAYGQKLRLSIFLISDGTANLGGSPKQVMTILGKGIYSATVYGIGVTSSSNREALTELVSRPIEDHLFILRDYDSILRLAETLTNGTIDYSVCGSTHRHSADTGKEDVTEARIAGGEDVQNAWSWMVEVKKVNPATNAVIGLCGGSIISRTWILTAAHCVCKVNTNITVRAEEIQIRLGLTDTKNASLAKNATVKRIVRHENYNGTTFENDIALLELQSNMTYNAYIRPICLPPEKLRNNSDFYRAKKHAFVIGWGEKGKLDTVEKLRQVKVTIHDDANCTRARNKNPFTDNMICAGGYGEGDSCKGGSGGPLMQAVVRDEYIWTQVGIVSWGHGERCDKRGKPVVYTKVSKYRRWIHQYVPDAQERSQLPLTKGVYP
ncbi:sushi, von Willebrand factor type A, EGF and pentraxin domain-containing protein 1-like [Ornithodoros turicata]|uniref:sushi, von Willebrand factor type A, EGF and pentraxin domain-containing protein 1-like n=1 Tax=Ornithodoros turicata TaxID=34597 RepID=UPI00313936E6